MNVRIGHLFAGGGHRKLGGTVLAIVAALAIGVHKDALAGPGDEPRVISDEWVMSVGGYLVEFRTSAGVGSGNVIGSVLRLEDELGLDPRKSFVRGDGFYRFNPRHAIGFGIWSLSRRGENSITDEIEWDDVTYTAFADIKSTFDVDWLRLDWRYSFMRMERGEAGINVGLSSYRFSASLEGMGSIGATSGSYRREESIVAPVPTLGMFVNFAITPNVLFRSSFNYLTLRIGDIDARVSDITLLFEWYFSEHVGIGGGSARTNITYQNMGSKPIDIQYEQAGVLAYFSFVWGDVD